MAVTFGLSLGISNMASAASISCGQCHGTAPLSSSATEQASGHRTGYESTPSYEDTKTPVAEDNCGNGRGLHGIHMNYSSASYGMKSATTRGNCNYCHNKHGDNTHENGFVGFSGTTPTARQKTGSVGLKFMDTGNTITSQAVGLALTNMGNGTGNCTAACHKGTSVGSPAPWGNYTSASVRLSCNACHDDISTVGAGLSGAHSAHLGNSAVITGGTPMNSAANAGCANCHTNNVGEGRATNDFGAKAYPHASDGTNVVSNNVNLTGLITSATKSGLNTTCAGACHPRSNELVPALTWGGTMDCNSCHYYPGLGGTNTGSGALPGAHELHITAGGITCDKCHVIPGNLSHATNMPPSPTGVTFAAGVGTVTGTGMNVTCQNSCHVATSPSWNTVAPVTGCATCHSYPNASSTLAFGGRGDWLNYTSISKGAIKYNGHLMRANTMQNATTPLVRQTLKHINVAAAYAPLTDTYAGVTGDAYKCGTCHKGATHMNGTKDVAANNNLGTTCSTNFTFNPATTISTPSATHSNATCSAAKCHFGRNTPNWN